MTAESKPIWSEEGKLDELLRLARKIDATTIEIGERPDSPLLTTVPVIGHRLIMFPNRPVVKGLARPTREELPDYLEGFSQYTFQLPNGYQAAFALRLRKQGKNQLALQWESFGQLGIETVWECFP